MLLKHDRLQSGISPRVSEVLQLIASEFATKEISAKLYISDHTVTTHRKSLMKKLGAKNTACLIYRGIANGILKLAICILSVLTHITEVNAQLPLAEVDGNIKVTGTIDMQLTADNESVIIGRSAGINNFTTDGVCNVFLGVNSGKTNFNGYDNTFVGHEAGERNVAGYQNVFIGRQAGANSTGWENVSIGNEAGKGLVDLRNAIRNVNIGHKAGYSQSTGQQNVHIGYEAGKSTVEASYNCFVGSKSGSNNTSGTSNSFFGQSSGFYNTSGCRNSFFGNSSGTVNITGNENCYFGYLSGKGNQEGSQNAAFGTDTGPGSADSIKVHSTALFGYRAGSRTAAHGSSFFGYESGTLNDIGAKNSFFGYKSGHDNTTGSSNSYFGYESGIRNETGDRNTFVGTFAGRDLIGSDNTILGAESVDIQYEGNRNTIIGANSVHGIALNSLLNDNVVIGSSIGNVHNPGSENIMIGNYVELSGSNGSNQIIIGHNAFGIGNNIAVIGNTDVNELYIGTDGNGTIHSSSDRRMKKQIAPSPLGLAFINSLKPVQYYWKSPSDYPEELGIKSNSQYADDQLQHGFIAQEVKEVIDLIGVDWQGWAEQSVGGRQSLDFNAFIAPIVNAIQELSLENDKLMQMNQMLIQRITSIESNLSNQSQSE